MPRGLARVHHCINHKGSPILGISKEYRIFASAVVMHGEPETRCPPLLPCTCTMMLFCYISEHGVLCLHIYFLDLRNHCCAFPKPMTAMQAVCPPSINSNPLWIMS